MRVEKGSTRNESFLYDAVVLSCDETFSAEEATATVTVETLFGKTKEITVTGQPAGNSSFFRRKSAMQVLCPRSSSFR